jgi:hypothetical protein
MPRFGRRRRRCSAVDDLFGKQSPHELWAWAVVDGNLPYSMAKPSLVAAFRAALPPELREKARIDLPSAAELKAAIGNLAAKLRQQIRVKFQGFPCLLAVDGGTLHRITLLNFVVLPMCSSRVAPLFVCSRSVDDCTSRTITKEVLEVKKYVQTMFGNFKARDGGFRSVIRTIDRLT